MSLAAIAAIAAIAMTALATVATAPAAYAEPPPDFMRGGTPPSASAVTSADTSALPRVDGKIATVLEINGAIGPATSRYITKALETARLNGSRIVVLQIDTPGGLDTSMRDIIRGILASPIPVVSYVSPSGARAASAGTYILYASHIAAMAPATNLGAATPVSIGGGNERPDDAKPPGKPSDGTDGKLQPAEPPPESAMERKVLNDAVAYIRGLAELRGRNADWAEQAVRDATSLSASQALKQNVIDVVALAERLAAPRTACSAQSALRPL